MIVKIDNNIFSNLRFNKCSIKLDEIEQKFLKSNFSTMEDINLNKIIKSLYALNERSDVRYFSNQHIKSIAKDLLYRINEEVGRNMQTVSYSSVPEIIKRSVNICTVTGKYILCINNSEVYFDDEDSAILYARNGGFY